MSDKNSFFGRLFGKAQDKWETVKMEKEETIKDNEIIVRSPMKGSIIPLSEVNDEVFSQGIMGRGIAIIPEEGKVYSPLNGKISAVFPTKHAVGIVDGNNAEVLIHVGMDTARLNGKYYKLHVKTDDIVKAGDLLLEFNMDKIKDAGFEVVTPVIITNTQSFSNIIVTDAESVDVKDRLITIVK